MTAQWICGIVFVSLLMVCYANENATNITTGDGTGAATLEEQISSNQVTIKLYNVKQAEFDSGAFSTHVASKVTTYCQENSTTITQCDINPTLAEDGVIFNSDMIVIGNYEQDGIDLQLTVAVLYPVNSSTDPELLVLPKQALIKCLQTDRRSFREVLGHDLVHLEGSTFYVMADSRLNAIISPIFAVITVFLLIATLLIRRHFANEEDKDRKEKLKRSIKAREMEFKTYKIRPGPEIMERQPSIKQKRPQRASLSRPINEQTDDQSTNNNSSQNQHSRGPYMDPQPSSHSRAQPALPPLENSSALEKKKRKKKKDRSSRNKIYMGDANTQQDASANQMSVYDQGSVYDQNVTGHYDYTEPAETV